MYVSREACISRATGHPLGMSALCGSSLRGKPYALCVGGVRRSSARHRMRSHAHPFHFRTGTTCIIHPRECKGACAYAYAQGYTLLWYAHIHNLCATSCNCAGHRVDVKFGTQTCPRFGDTILALYMFTLRMRAPYLTV